MTENQPPYGPPSNPPPGPGQPGGQYPPPYGAYPQRPPMFERDARLWASAAHWVPLALMALSAGTLMWAAPLVIWLMHRDRSWLVDVNAKEALNFQITLVIVYLISIPLMFVFVGFLTLAAAGILAIVWGIQGALAANRGEAYRYPISIRFVK